MRDTIADRVPVHAADQPVPYHVWMWRRVKRYAPGLLALAAVGYLALLASYFLTGLQYVPTAVLLGAFISNTFGAHPALHKGISTYELWLKAGIVLLGAQIAFSSLGPYLLKALPVAALAAALSIYTVLAVGRLLALPDRLCMLLAAGTGVCGVSAIIHTAPEIGADDEEIEYAVGAILVLGAAAIVLYPLVGSVTGLSEQVYGLWTGLSVNNTAEAVATGYSFTVAAGSIAIATKLCRVLMLGPAVAFLGSRARSEPGARRLPGVRQAWRRLPKFVLVFLGFSLVASTGVLSDGDLVSLSNTSQWLFLLAFAGIGFKLRWADIRTVGPRPVIAVAVASVFLSAITLLASLLVAPVMF